MDEPKAESRTLNLAQLEELLNRENEWDTDDTIEILPNGEIRAKGGSRDTDLVGRKPLTFRENLGGEYGELQPRAA
jgi:hypothetical protein